MDWMHNLRSTATLSSMNAQPVGPYILCCIYQLADHFPRKDVGKFWHSIWCHQSTTTSCFQPPSMTPGTTAPVSPPSPTATATHHHHWPPTTTAHNQQQNNQWWCGKSQATTTTSTTPNDKEHLKTNTNDPTHKWWPSPMNGHMWQWAKVRQLTSPPLPSNMKSRCHVAVSNVAGTTITWHNNRQCQGCPTTTQPGHAATTCS